jgi:hypothetical protein
MFSELEGQFSDTPIMMSGPDHWFSNLSCARSPLHMALCPSRSSPTDSAEEPVFYSTSRRTAMAMAFFHPR